MKQEIVYAAKTVWDWLPQRDDLKRADMLLVLGSSPTEAPEWSAELWHSGYAPLIVASGGFGRISGDNQLPEADLCAQTLDKRGVPKSAIIIENRSSNTGENIAFSKGLLEKSNIHITTGIIVTTPLLSRRQKSSLEVQWPEIDWQVTAPKSHSVEDCIATQGDEFLHLIVGELDRLELYPKKGFAKEVLIPEAVLDAKEKLIESGFIKYLLT